MFLIFFPSPLFSRTVKWLKNDLQAVCYFIPLAYCVTKQNIDIMFVSIYTRNNSTNKHNSTLHLFQSLVDQHKYDGT
jgi:hypothetical protein